MRSELRRGKNHAPRPGLVTLDGGEMGKEDKRKLASRGGEWEQQIGNR